MSYMEPTDFHKCLLQNNSFSLRITNSDIDSTRHINIWMPFHISLGAPFPVQSIPVQEPISQPNALVKQHRGFNTPTPTTTNNPPFDWIY